MQLEHAVPLDAARSARAEEAELVAGALVISRGELAADAPGQQAGPRLRLLPGRVIPSIQPVMVNRAPAAVCA